MTWIIGLLCGILEIIEYSFTQLLDGFLVLAVGTTAKGIQINRLLT